MNLREKVKKLEEKAQVKEPEKKTIILTYEEEKNYKEKGLEGIKGVKCLWNEKTELYEELVSEEVLKGCKVWRLIVTDKEVRENMKFILSGKGT